MFSLKKGVAVITSASSGLGRQMIYSFARQGADIVIMARRIDRLEELQIELETYKIKCLTIKCDVTNTEEVNSTAHLVEKEFGKVDILVNCAGASEEASYVTGVILPIDGGYTCI